MGREPPNGGEAMKRTFTFLFLCVALAKAALGDELVSSDIDREARLGHNAVLIRNVSLIDPNDEDSLVKVSLLVVDKRLDVISEDPIPASEAQQVFDARDGVVLGRLKLGEPASFMILDGDPRDNVDVLLDTKTHARFAIRAGEIIRNQLSAVNDTSGEGPVDPSERWLAYSAPPLAVPLDYFDTSKFNRFDTRAVNGVFAAALALDRTNWLDQSAGSTAQVGNLDAFDGGEIRGLRLGGVGTINFEKPWVWTLFGATNAFDQGFDSAEDDDFVWLDVRVDVPLLDATTLSIGKQKEPISLERLTPLTNLPMQERSAVADALLPARNTGALISSPVFNERMVLAAGVFNDFLDRDQPDSPGENATAFVGRATWVSFEDTSGSTLLHLGAAFRHSNTKEGALVRTEPEINSAPNFVSSDLFAADGSDLYQLEASMRSGRLWVHGEYMWADVDAEALLDPRVSGYHMTAAWSLSGEMRNHNRRVGIFDRQPIARTVHQNGWGSLEASLRYSAFDANDGLLEAGDMDIASAGLTWWLSPYFQVSVNYRYVTLDKDGLTGTSHGINSRVVLILE